ncbi:hypothetical protein ACLB2K_059276 [Fragaria x ananassa]
MESQGQRQSYRGQAQAAQVRYCVARKRPPSHVSRFGSGSVAEAWRKHSEASGSAIPGKERIQCRRRRVVIGCGAKQTKTGGDRVKKRETERLMVKKLAKRKSRRSSPRRGLQEHNRQDREKDLSQEANRKAEEAKNKTSETAQQAKEKTQSTMSQVKDKAAEEARRKAQEAAEKGKETTQAGKEKTSGILQQTGETMRNVAQGAADAVKSTIGMGKKDEQDDPLYKGTAPATTRTNTGTTGAPGTGNYQGNRNN